MIDSNEVPDYWFCGLAVQGKGQIYLKSVLGLLTQTFMGAFILGTMIAFEV